MCGQRSLESEVQLDGWLSMDQFSLTPHILSTSTGISESYSVLSSSLVVVVTTDNFAGFPSVIDT